MAEKEKQELEQSNVSRHHAVIEVERVNKSFLVGDKENKVLKNINLRVYATDFLVIYGPSGCGKSTLLNLILGLDEPTSGEVELREKKINLLNEDDRAAFRAAKMGVVYQMPHWITSLNVLENVALPLIIDGTKESEALKQAVKILSNLGITNLANQIPTQLSGGEQQKAGLARALVTNPWILVADEPTGNLDSKSGSEIMDLLKSLNHDHKRTIVLVTHNEEYFNFGTRWLEMKDGEIVKESRG